MGLSYREPEEAWYASVWALLVVLVIVALLIVWVVFSSVPGPVTTTARPRQVVVVPGRGRPGQPAPQPRGPGGIELTPSARQAFANARSSSRCVAASRS